jgi:HK97 family phage major capsid protein
MQRLNELGSLNDQVYFKMSKRTDGRLTDANAVVTYTHGADS